MLGRASHRLPRVGSPHPQEKVLRPAGVRHSYEGNLYVFPRCWMLLSREFRDVVFEDVGFEYSNMLLTLTN